MLGSPSESSSLERAFAFYWRALAMRANPFKLTKMMAFGWGEANVA